MKFFNNKSPRGKQKIATTILIVMLLSIICSTSACAETPEPTPADPKLPSGIFILDNMRWEHSFTWEGIKRPTDSIYDSDGKLIKIIRYNNGQIAQWISGSIDYSTRQIGENRAEVYETESQRWKMSVTDIVNDTEYTADTTITIGPKLYGVITIEEGKKVYYNNMLLYDFSLNVGDQFIICPEYEKIPFELVSIDSALLIDTEYRKRYNFETNKSSFPWGHYEFSVVETIGCTQQLFHTLNVALHEASQLPILQKVYYKNNLIWSRY